MLVRNFIKKIFKFDPMHIYINVYIQYDTWVGPWMGKITSISYR